VVLNSEEEGRGGNRREEGGKGEGRRRIVKQI